MNTVDLKQFIERHHVMSRTMNGFWVYLNNWKEDVDDFEETFRNMDLDTIEVKIKKISLTINCCTHFQYNQIL